MANVRANHRADPIRLHFTFLEDIFQGFLSTVCLFSCELKRGKGCLWRKTELVCVYFGNAIGGFWPFRSDFIALSFKCQALLLNQSGKDQNWFSDIHTSVWVKKYIYKTSRVPWKITSLWWQRDLAWFQWNPLRQSNCCYCFFKTSVCKCPPLWLDNLNRSCFCKHRWSYVVVVLVLAWITWRSVSQTKK